MRVRRLAAGQTIEIATPNLAFTVREPGDFRIVVNPDGQTTDVVVRRGRGDAYGDGAAYQIDTRQAYRFSGTELSDYQYLNAPRADEFDRWARDRDRNFDSSVSARYVSYDVVGYEDLDNYGTWRRDATYGNVWEPRRVASGWTPYRDGHWSWIDPWGWTWVDDAPWGYAVSHYGRWANLGSSWAWVPGPVRSRAYYAPALAAFIGALALQSSGAGSNTGTVAWFPLAPREVYRPSYAVSRSYYQNLNSSNTTINNTVIQNTYNTYNTTQVTNVVYVNRQVAGAVVAVPRTTFVQSQPVARVAVRVSNEVLAIAPISAVAAVAPTEKSVRGAVNAAGRPPGRVFERPVVARVAPPAAKPAFAAQLAQLATTGGQAARRGSTQGSQARSGNAGTGDQAGSSGPTIRTRSGAAAAGQCTGRGAGHRATCGGVCPSRRACSTSGASSACGTSSTCKTRPTSDARPASDARPTCGASSASQACTRFGASSTCGASPTCDTSDTSDTSGARCACRRCAVQTGGRYRPRARRQCTATGRRHPARASATRAGLGGACARTRISR